MNNSTFLSLMQSDPILAIVFLVSLVISISVHEAAHAYAANYFGDDTPYLMGRLTLNPVAHLDPIGTIMLILFGFGWGRPVLINPNNFSRKIDELLVALAGPLSNIVFAILLNILVRLTIGISPVFALFLTVTASLNVMLAALNLLPIPPLDGSSIIAYFWPEYRSAVGSQIGLIILIVLLLLGLVPVLMNPLIDIFTQLTHLYGLL